MDYQPPPFFSRGPAPLVRLGFFVSLAVLLMVLDARFRYAESLRQAVAFLVYPFHQAAAGRERPAHPRSAARRERAVEAIARGARTPAAQVHPGRNPLSGARSLLAQGGPRQGQPAGNPGRPGGHRRYRRHRPGDAGASAACGGDSDHGQGAENPGAGREERAARHHLRRRGQRHARLELYGGERRHPGR